MLKKQNALVWILRPSSSRNFPSLTLPELHCHLELVHNLGILLDSLLLLKDEAAPMAREAFAQVHVHLMY